MKKWLCLILLSLFGLALLDSASRAADTKCSNILWLIAEDMSPDLGCYGTQQVWTSFFSLLGGHRHPK